MSNGETDKIDKKVVKTQATMATAISAITPDVLNLSIFLSTINQIILGH